MFCPKCGHNNPAEAKFCAKCGGSMLGVATNVASSHASAPASGGSPAVADGLKWGILAGSLIIPLIGIIMGAVYLFDSKSSPEKKSVGKLWLWTGVGLAVLYAMALG